jgi:hypothetical protein
MARPRSAGPNELPALKEFFGMYRATADGDDSRPRS